MIEETFHASTVYVKILKGRPQWRRTLDKKLSMLKVISVVCDDDHVSQHKSYTSCKTTFPC